MVVAWRVRLGRELPAARSSQTSNSGCWRSSPRRKDAPKNLGEAVSLVAALGGHTQTGSARFAWLGYAQLAAMAFFRELEDEYQ